MKTSTSSLTAFCLLVFSGSAIAEEPAGQLLYSGSAEYGWSFRGVNSWGNNWQARARSEALGQIQHNIASMVNLKQLDTFTKVKHDTKIDAEYLQKIFQKGGKISYVGNKSREEQQKWINGNNFLITVRNVSIKEGTEYEKHDINNRQERTQIYSATMVYEYSVYGPKVDQERRREIHYTIKNATDRVVKFEMQPSGKDYTLEPGKTFKGMSYEINGKAPTITLKDSGKAFKLSAGDHKLWWMTSEKRVAFDRDGN